MKSFMKKITILFAAISALFLLSSCSETKKEKEETKENICEHQYASEVTKEASCAEEGETTYTCSACGDTYTEAIEKTTEHSYTSKVTKMATCAEEGETEYTCSVCSKKYTEKISKTTVHKYISEITTKATCQKEGVKTNKCSVCNITNAEQIAKLSHKYKAKETAKATCTTAGKTTYTCTECGDSYENTIAAKGHKWENATCTKAKQCSVCKQTEGKALGHIENGENCSRCGAELINTAKIKAIEEENKRHNSQILMITTQYEAKIKLNNNIINNLMNQVGINYVSSESYYLNQRSIIQNELNNARARLMYASSEYDRVIYQRQVDALEQEYQDINLCLEIAKLAEKNEMLERECERRLDQEEIQHESNLNAIEKQYG